MGNVTEEEETTVSKHDMGTLYKLTKTGFADMPVRD